MLLRTDYPDLELLIVDNDSTERETIALFNRLHADRAGPRVAFPGAFNYSALNNAAVREATGQVLVLLNNDIDVIGRDWLREMVSQAMRLEVGAVGAKLLYPTIRCSMAACCWGSGALPAMPACGRRSTTQAISAAWH